MGGNGGWGDVPGPRRGWAWQGCSEAPTPILHLRVRLAVSQLRKSLNSGSETHVTPNRAAPPSACPPHGRLWQPQTAWPRAHSCPLVFFLAPTPAIQWGLKPQKAGVSLLASVPVQSRVAPPHPVPRLPQLFRPGRPPQVCPPSPWLLSKLIDSDPFPCGYKESLLPPQSSSGPSLGKCGPP